LRMEEGSIEEREESLHTCMGSHKSTQNQYHLINYNYNKYSLSKL